MQNENKVNVIISDFFDCFEYNQFLIRMFEEERHKFYDDISIVGLFGCFETIFDGRNDFYAVSGVKYINTIYEFCRQNNLTVYLTYSNPFIDKVLVKEHAGNQYLKLAGDCDYKVVLASPTLEEHLIDNGIDNEKIVYDQEMVLNYHKYDINLLSENNCVLLSPEYNCDLDYIRNIKRKENIILYAQDPCLDNCPLKPVCLKNRIDYHLKLTNQIEKCPYGVLTENYYRTVCSRNKYIDRKKVEEVYLPLGINTFVIGNQNTTIDGKLEGYIDFLIKPEYKVDARMELMNMETEKDIIARRTKNE